MPGKDFPEYDTVHFLSNRQTIAEKAILFQISLRAQKRGARLLVLEGEIHELIQLSKKVSNLGYLELIEGGWKTDQGLWTCISRVRTSILPLEYSRGFL